MVSSPLCPCNDAFGESRVDGFSKMASQMGEKPTGYMAGVPVVMYPVMDNQVSTGDDGILCSPGILLFPFSTRLRCTDQSRIAPYLAIMASVSECC